MTIARPQTYRFHNGSKAALPFADAEYAARLEGLRDVMELHGLDAIVLTSAQNVAYYSGFLYCAFGRPCACVVTGSDCVTVSAGRDGGQPWRRSIGDNISYTDGPRDNFWCAVAGVVGTGKAVGVEGDHLTLVQSEKLNHFLKLKRGMDIAPATMAQRMMKSEAEINLIRQAAQVADLGGYAIRDALISGKGKGLREIDVAMAGRDAMEVEIAKRFPDAEYRDTWVWFQSGLNTDGAHNPVTGRVLQHGDILGLSCFPMISGYCTALKRTLFLGAVDASSLKIWQANVALHDYGMSLLKPGATCSVIAAQINDVLSAQDLPQHHSLCLLSQFDGQAAGFGLHEDSDAVLEKGMVIAMEQMLTIADRQPGAGGYRERDILVITEAGSECITAYPYGPDFNVVG